MIFSSNPKERERLQKRMDIIVKILEGKYGYKNARENYGKTMVEMGTNDMPKYMEFLKLVDEEAKKHGC